MCARLRTAHPSHTHNIYNAHTHTHNIYNTHTHTHTQSISMHQPTRRRSISHIEDLFSPGRMKCAGDRGFVGLWEAPPTFCAHHLRFNQHSLERGEQTLFCVMVMRGSVAHIGAEGGRSYANASIGCALVNIWTPPDSVVRWIECQCMCERMPCLCLCL